MNVGSLPARHARYRPQQAAIVFEDRRLSWLEFNQRVNRAANALRGVGLKKGDKVATILPNCLELFESYWAIVKIGAVIVPLSSLLRGKGLLNLLRDSDTTAVITNACVIKELESIESQLPNITSDRFISIDEAEGYQSYAALAAAANNEEPPAVEIT
ncbi:MAG TPA: AMP-binding protein, partial [Pyrinomonadaceae bacterium]|nr:AMP-binding protein [Pyrinomonadaceae bacterium]